MKSKDIKKGDILAWVEHGTVAHRKFHNVTKVRVLDPVVGAWYRQYQERRIGERNEDGVDLCKFQPCASPKTNPYERGVLVERVDFKPSPNRHWIEKQNLVLPSKLVGYYDDVRKELEERRKERAKAAKAAQERSDAAYDRFRAIRDRFKAYGFPHVLGGRGDTQVRIGVEDAEALLTKIDGLMEMVKSLQG